MIQEKFLIILGIGNPIRKDDGAGIKVVENLECDNDLIDFNISYKYLNTGGFDILDEIDGYECAIIIDATAMAEKDLKPGEFFHITNLHVLERKKPTDISSHGIDVLDILNYADLGVYNVPQKIEVFGIQIKETNCFSETLSPEVEEGVFKLTLLLKSRIINYFL